VRGGQSLQTFLAVFGQLKVKSVANNNKKIPYNILYLELGEMPHFPDLTSIQDFVNSKIQVKYFY
jgi:hypothetical protein